jgi:pSer/pThr/pTyr-binding forkhead associated (FHA) protein
MEASGQTPSRGAAAAGSLTDGLSLRLEVIAGNAAGTILLVEDDLIIGRQVEGPGHLAGDEEISRSHARISREPAGHCAIEDLGSTNGTFVNGLRIGGPQTLSEGDTIEVGATTLVVRETPRVASMQPQAAELATSQPTVVPHRVAAEPRGEQPPTPVSAAREPAAPEPAAEVETREPAAPEPPAGKPAAHVPSAVEPVAPEPPAEKPAAQQPAESAAPPAGIDETPPVVSLRLEIDLSAREAEIALGDSSDRVRFVFEAGAWRLVPPSG